jgi:catechol 2,3-dioxygenase
MASDPVDVRGLLSDAERSDRPWTGLPEGTTLGHIHLQVGDIPRAEAFYQEVFGFDIVARMPSALFVSAGGYHHHLGMNTWHSSGAGPALAGTAGLRFFTVDFASEEARQAVMARIEAAGLTHTSVAGVVAVHDPWQNVILLQVGSAGDAQTTKALSEAFDQTRGATTTSTLST